MFLALPVRRDSAIRSKGDERCLSICVTAGSFGAETVVDGQLQGMEPFSAHFN